MTEHQEPTIKFIDLFCGIGSFHYAFKKLGYECVMASDIYQPAIDNYKNNHGLEPLGDICDIDVDSIPDHSILCCAPPCQSFSQAGKQKGFLDLRGTMFFHVMRIVESKKPKIVVLENVPALLTNDNGNSFKTMKEDLENKGYRVIHRVLICSDYGIPQKRKRLIMIAFSDNIIVNNIESFFDLTAYEKSTTLSEYLGKDFKRTNAFTIRCGGRCSKITDRHNWDRYYIGDDGTEYRLTIEDALKLQGFIDFSLTGKDTHKWKLLGNTIPTVFTEIIGKQLLKHCPVLRRDNA
jgi:DNA (cytosine-5)-methyltransferase 1